MGKINKQQYNEEFFLSLIDSVAQRASEHTLEKQARREKIKLKKEHDKRLHNTRMLLQNYRRFKRADFSNKEMLILMNDKIDFSDLRWKVVSVSDNTHSSFLDKSRKTHFSIERVDWALKWFRSDCQESKDKRDEIMYKVIYDIYLDVNIPVNKVVSYDEISKKYEISTRTISNYINKAISRIEPYIWGIDLLNDFNKNSNN